MSSDYIETPALTQYEQSAAVSVESVLRVVAELKSAEKHKFKEDLEHYNTTGQRTEFILRVLKAAANELRQHSRILAE